MKSFLLLFTLALTVLTVNAQQVFLTQQEADPKTGEQVVSVYEQLAQHTLELKEAKSEFEQQLAEATGKSKQAELQAIITNIDEMIELNQRLQAGKAMIHSADAIQN